MIVAALMKCSGRDSSWGYPPIILHQAYLVYSGARYLQAEHTVAPVIRANTGILAGCPAAPSIAKLILHDVAAELSEKTGDFQSRCLD